jgi:hypothetical protein
MADPTATTDRGDGATMLPDAPQRRDDFVDLPVSAAFVAPLRDLTQRSIAMWQRDHECRDYLGAWRAVEVKLTAPSVRAITLNWGELEVLHSEVACWIEEAAASLGIATDGLLEGRCETRQVTDILSALAAAVSFMQVVNDRLRQFYECSDDPQL